MATTQTANSIIYPDGSEQSRKGIRYTKILNGNFAVAWGTWINLFQGTSITDYGYNRFLFYVQWAYNYSYYSGHQHFSTQGGFFQMPAYQLTGGTNMGALGYYSMNGHGCYNEYAGLYWPGGPSSNYWQIYCNSGGGSSGYVPNAGGTAYWYVYLIQ